MKAALIPDDGDNIDYNQRAAACESQGNSLVHTLDSICYTSSRPESGLMSCSHAFPCGIHFGLGTCRATKASLTAGLGLGSGSRLLHFHLLQCLHFDFSDLNLKAAATMDFWVAELA